MQPQKITKVSPEVYLTSERISDEKHEYVNGYFYVNAMVGASKNHERISINLLSVNKNLLKNKLSIGYIFSSDIKV